MCAPLSDALMQLRQCLVASKNRRDMDNNNPNFPDTHRYTITAATRDQLLVAFKALQSSDEFKNLYPESDYRFVGATSGTTVGVFDFKIEPRQQGKSAIFNFHIAVQ